jgi:glycosyltransferase involved in cell wall biosynthesis
MSSVDVIIPCYNYGHFLGCCVESVLTQRDVALRVLIIDDASTDGSAKVASEIAAQNDLMEFRGHTANRGAVATFNEGLDWAAADYTLIISADDVLTPGALARAVGVMEAQPEIGFTYGQQILVQKDGLLPEIPLISSDRAATVLAGGAFFEQVSVSGHNPVSAPSAVVRTTVQKQLGGYRSELPFTHDMEMWLRFAAHRPVAILDAYQVFKRCHGHNLSIQFTHRALVGIRERKAAFVVAFRNYGDRLPAIDLLRRRAWQSLAQEAFWAGSKLFDMGDEAGCRQCLEFALETYPELRWHKEWSRLKWKRRLGIKLWSKLRHFIYRMRRHTVSP